MKRQQVAQWVNQLLQQYTGQVTVRQLFYRLVSPPYQVFSNTLGEYHKFDRHLVHARERGEVDWRRISDLTRRIISVQTWDSTSDFMSDIYATMRDYHNIYHYNRWMNQDNALKILVEKEALAQIIADVAGDYYVDVAPIRGYGSFTQIKRIALDIAQSESEGKHNVVLYLGDFDPTGLDIDKSTTQRLSDYSGAGGVLGAFFGGVSIDFERVALIASDVVNLPPNPVKMSDARAPDYVAKYGNNCWELDALPPNQLQDRVRAAIESRIDMAQWNADIEEEKEHRTEIQLIIDEIIGGRDGIGEEDGI